MKLYTGTMNTRSKLMSKSVRRAYGVWNAQRQRCTNKKNKSYKDYGSKGIGVEYTAREFIAWWLNQFKNKNLKYPSVGRIDHSKNYSFANIEMVERAENSREMYHRTGGNEQVVRRPVVLVNKNETIAFCSAKLAARFARISEPMIKIRKKNPVDLENNKTKFRHNVYALDQFMELKL